jgi:CxxC-x17-CxxC domain-containing protein
MKKSVKRKKSSIQPHERPDMTGLINKMVQQLASLEAKIDGLVSLASPASAIGRRPDPVQRPLERKQENGFRERVLHKAVCAECSKECEVPFKPSGDRPVYCKECFTKRKNSATPPKEKPENRSAERVLVYERSFQKDQALSAQRSVEKKRPTARRRR